MMNQINILFTVTVFFIGIQTGFCQTSEIGLASFYSDKFEEKTTASGQLFEQYKMTAAHLTLPFNTRIKVTNLENNRSVIVTINDRGPHIKDRILDLSKAAAIELDFFNKGLAKVKLEIIEKE